jgi:hypothetical protein
MHHFLTVHQIRNCAHHAMDCEILEVTRRRFTSHSSLDCEPEAYPAMALKTSTIVHPGPDNMGPSIIIKSSSQSPNTQIDLCARKPFAGPEKQIWNFQPDDDTQRWQVRDCVLSASADKNRLGTLSALLIVSWVICSNCDTFASD